jgi:O-antigen/teichoic acid export membrane protein
LFAAAVALGIVVAAPWLIPLLFGREFEPAVHIAQILAVGGVLDFALLADSGRLFGQGRPWAVALAHIAGAATFSIGIVISSTLPGIAWASTASYGVSYCLTSFLLSGSRGERRA